MTRDRKLLITSLVLNAVLIATAWGVTVAAIQLEHRNRDLQVYIDAGCRGHYEGAE